MGKFLAATNLSKWIGISLILVSLVLIPASSTGATTEEKIGPYTVINLPLEDLPEYDPGFFYNPIISDFPGGGSLQVLYVLKDPRDVPLVRYGYWDQNRGLVVGPNDEFPGGFTYVEKLDAILDLDPITINVYVRVQAPDDTAAPDPLFGGEERQARPILYVPIDGPYRAELSTLSCAVPEYATGISPYAFTPGVDGRDAVNKEGLYDPKAYTPPLPWYPYEEAALQPGEIREGWINCMAPDVPLDAIRVSAKYLGEPEIINGEEESVELIGEEQIGTEGCVEVDSFDDPACQEAVCCTVVLVPSSTVDFLDEPVDEGNSDEQEPIIEGEEYQKEYRYADAWNFNQVRSLPEEGIRVENVSLLFRNSSGEELADKGSLVIKSADIANFDRGYYDYQFISEMSVSPNALSISDIEGFELDHIGLVVDVYDGVGTFRNALLDQGGEVFWDFYATESPLEVYAFGSLWIENDTSLQSALWFTAAAERDELLPRMGFRYPAKGMNTGVDSLKSVSNMCDFVDCQEVSDPTADIAQMRTVPVFCPGEWANNFSLSNMRSEDVYYFGIPKGLESYPPAWADASVGTNPVEIWFFEGEILGGLTPWWIDGYDTYEFGRDTQLEGTVINKSNGHYVDLDTLFLPLFDQQRNQRTYYAEVDERVIGHGWMPGLINQGLVIAGRPEENTSFQNKLFMFHTEGPIWTRSCSRPLLTNLEQLGLYAAGASSAGVSGGEEQNITNLFPGMEYPLSMPKITGDLYSLGEVGEKAYGYTFKPTEVDVVPGRPNNSIVYVRQEDKFYPANDRVNDNNEAFFRNVNAEIIPPGNSLVFVKIEKDPPEGPIECQYINNEIFSLTYPGLYPATSQPGNFRSYGLFTISCPEDFSEAWLVFIVPTLEIAVDKLIFTMRGEEYWSMWRLD